MNWGEKLLLLKGCDNCLHSSVLSITISSCILHFFSGAVAGGKYGSYEEC